MTDSGANDAQGHLRAEARAHKRERILETATRLFYEQGYRATSMESIADELSATKPFIYYHFKNKYDILEEIALRVLRMAIDSLLRAEAAGGEPAEVVGNMVRNYGQLVTEQQRIIAVFWREESNFSEATRRKVFAEQRKFLDTLSRVIQAGVDKGVFAVDSLELTALAIMNLVTFTYTWYRPDGELHPSTLSEHNVQLVLRMLRP